MNKDFIHQLLIYVAVFGITDNGLKYMNISTEKKIIQYTILLIITINYIK